MLHLILLAHGSWVVMLQNVQNMPTPYASISCVALVAQPTGNELMQLYSFFCGESWSLL